jgi:hypothetical protein
LFHPTRLRVRLSPIASSLQSVLRSPVCLYPLAFIYHRRDVPSRSYLLWFKALTISTHSDSQTLTKHVPFASVFPLLKWKQVMRLGAFKAHSTLQKKNRAYSSKFSPPDCYQLSSARTYSLLRNDPPSRSPSVQLSPSGYTFPTLSAFASRKLRDFPRSSAHSIPSILTLNTSMSLAGHIPFVLSCKICISQRFPRFHGGSPYIAATSGSLHSGLDFACRPFRFPLARDTLSVLLQRRGGPLLRLRYFKG